MESSRFVVHILHLVLLFIVQGNLGVGAFSHITVFHSVPNYSPCRYRSSTFLPITPRTNGLKQSANEFDQDDDISDLWFSVDGNDAEDDDDDDDDDDFENQWNQPSKTSALLVEVSNNNVEVTTNKKETKLVFNKNDDDDEDDAEMQWGRNINNMEQLKSSMVNGQGSSSTENMSSIGIATDSSNTVRDRVSDYRRDKRRRTPEFWKLRLELLRDYYNHHGHIDVPHLYKVVEPSNENDSEKEDNMIRLGMFVTSLRGIFEKGDLENSVPSDFIKELNAMGMRWNFLGRGRRPANFESRIAEWTSVTTNNTASSEWNPSLRVWMWNQRYLFDKQLQGRDGPLTPDRIQALTAAGILPYRRPQDRMQTAWDSEWNQSLLRWQEYVESKPREKMNESVMLWSWEQWRAYDILRGKSDNPGRLPVLLTGPRLQLLRKGGFFRAKGQYPIIPPEVDTSSIPLDWDTFVATIEDFWKQHGTTDVSPLYEISETHDDQQQTPLYSACARLKWEHRKIEMSCEIESDRKEFILNEERIAILKGLQFFDNEANARVAIRDEYSWWESYHDLRRYQAVHGTCNVTDDRADLYDWVQEQRRLYTNLVKGVDSPNFISETHFAALIDLGMVFEEHALSELDPPVSSTAKSILVGRKPAVLRLDGDSAVGDLDSLRLPVRGKLKGSFEDLAWMVRLDEMRQFIQDNGHCGVLQSTHPKLALWVYNQRRQYQKRLQGNKSALTPKRIQLLQEIDFDFEEQIMDASQVGSVSWDKMLEALERYRDAHGHCFVPASLPSNPVLGEWVHMQRQLYQQQFEATFPGKNVLGDMTALTVDRIRLLETVGLDLRLDNISYGRQAFQSLWNERLEELTQFKEKYGHCDPASVVGDMKLQLFDLSNWTREQRQFYRLWKDKGISSHLTPDRINALNALGFDWEPRT